MQARREEEDEMYVALEEPSAPGAAAGDVPAPPRGAARAALPPGGWYELKYVRGCGPYLYFRYHDGNVRRTVYLGKANAEVTDWVRAHQRRPGVRRLRGRSAGRRRLGPG